ncbi:MAG: replication initiation factor domain-containing protein [Anaeroplasmataceae bacterium]
MIEKLVNEAPPSKTGRHVIIDYFRATFELLVVDSNDEEIVVREKVFEIAEFLGVQKGEVCERTFRRDKYKYMFDLGPEMEIGMIGPKSRDGIPTCSIHLRGKGCREYEARNPNKTWKHFFEFMLVDNAMKPSRIDVSIDDYEGKDVTIPWLLEKLNKKQFTSCFKHKYHKIHGCDEEGFSIELGSRTSTCQLVIYDKLKEQKKKNKEVNQDYWVRYEMRFFHEKATKVAHEILASFGANRDQNGDIDEATGFLKYVNSLLLGVLDIKEDNNYDVAHQCDVKTDSKWNEFLYSPEKWKVVPEINRENRWKNKMVSVKRTMPNYFLVQFLKANCNPYMFTTYLLQDFREYFDKLHSKAQLKIVNDYLIDIGIEPIDDKKLYEIESILDFAIEERKLPF